MKSRGFTLLELILSGTIGMLIMVSAYAVYKSAANDQKTKEVADLVKILFNDAQMITSTKSVFEVQNSGGGTHDLTMADLINAKGNVSEYPNYTSLVSSTALSSPLGGDVSISTESSAPNAKDLVAITISRVPRRNCSQLLARLVDANVYDIKVNNQLIALEPAATANSIGRNDVRMDQASQVCSGQDWGTVVVRQLKEINISKMRAGPSYGALMTSQESAILTPLYNRQEAALTSREVAQLAIP